jgi:hypothetical protein
MATSSGVFALLFALLSGGANDMLDFVSSDAYWKAKGVTVSVEQLTADLKTPAAADVAAFIKALGSGSYPEREEAARKIIAVGVAAIPSLEKSSDDPDAEVANHARSLTQQIRLNSKANSVRRLMAIRTLGEMKKADALPALKALLDSKEMFVADYAARSIAQIEGKPAPVRTIAAEALNGDLSLLPANCAVVGQTRFSGGKAFNLDQILKDVPAQPGEDRAAALNMMTTSIIQVADQVGNIRVESVTVGVSDNVGPNDGFAAIVVHGQYDAQAVSALVRKSIPNASTIEGVEVLSPEEHMALAFLSDNRAMAITGASKEKLPVKEVLAALQAKPNPAGHPLLATPEFAPFVASLNDSVHAWAVCKVSDSYRVAPFIAPFDTITLLGKQEKDGMNIRFAGAGKDAAAVKGAVDQINSGLAQAKQEMPRIVQQVPAMKPVADFVQAIKCDADGKNATLTSSFQGDITTLLAMPFMMFASERQPVVVQPPAAVQVQRQADAPAAEKNEPKK